MFISNNYVYCICLGNLCIIEKNVFKDRCLAGLNMKRSRIQWLIAICWNNYDNDSVKNHACHNQYKFHKTNVGMCNNHSFVSNEI